MPDKERGREGGREGEKKKDCGDEKQTICGSDRILKAILYWHYSDKLLLCVGVAF